jgi:GNAT superfamily N-acetyltransferase
MRREERHPSPDRRCSIRDHPAVLDDIVLARLGHLNFLAFGRESALWSEKGTVLDEGGVLAHAAGTAFSFVMNAAYRTDPSVEPVDVLARADAFFGAHDRDYTVVAGPQDDDLATHLEAEGCWQFGSSPEMVCRARLADADPPEGVELRTAVTERDIDDFITVGSGAYATLGMDPHAMQEAIDRPDRLLQPHLHLTLAYLDGEPVAAAQALLSHGIAGVYWVGTLEPARGRGLGEAVTRVVTNWAFDQGARAQSLQASTMGEPIYARMGYEELYRYRSYLRTRS